MITIIDAKGRATEVRNRLRAFTIQHPFTALTAAIVAAFVAGVLLG